jgi:hypothetical protein
VDDQTPPFSFVMVEGPVELSSDLDELRRVVDDDRQALHG